MIGPRWLVEALLELVFPETCALCGRDPGTHPWCPRDLPVPGLRFWDGTHLCTACADSLADRPVAGRVVLGDGDSWPVVAAAWTHPDLVRAVGQFKYHGLRGLAWPLAGLLSRPLRTMCTGGGGVAGLIPVALHVRRRRSRGFNQAELLARLLAHAAGIPLLDGVLIRRRNTGQQARLANSRERRRNLAGAFTASPPQAGEGVGSGGRARVILVDDLVTSGCTAGSAAGVLRAAGWEVGGIIALGLAKKAKNTPARVDTWERGF